jgi:VanZ family protein
MNIKLFIKPLIWLALICYGLFTPSGRLPKTAILNIPHFDKIVHFGLFFIFCLLLFKPIKKLKMNHLYLAPVISLILAATLESVQHMISTSRSSNLYDFMANAAGIIVSVFIFHFIISGRRWEKYF